MHTTVLPLDGAERDENAVVRDGARSERAAESVPAVVDEAQGRYPVSQLLPDPLDYAGSERPPGRQVILERIPGPRDGAVYDVDDLER